MLEDLLFIFFRWEKNLGLAEVTYEARGDKMTAIK